MEEYVPPTKQPVIQPMSFTSNIHVVSNIPTISIKPAILKPSISVITSSSKKMETIDEHNASESDNLIPEAKDVDAKTETVVETVIESIVSSSVDVSETIAEPIIKASVQKVSEILIQKLQLMQTVKVEEHVLVLIHAVMQDPLFFDNDLVVIIGEIVKDEVINSADIPKLFMLFERLYNLMNGFRAFKIDDLGKLCLDSIHLLLVILVAEKLIALSPEHIVLIDKILKSCVNMAKTIRIVKPKKGWLKKFMCCFGK